MASLVKEENKHCKINLPVPIPMPFQRLMETSVVKVGWVLFVCFCFYFLLCVVYVYFVLEGRSRISQERDTEVQGGGIDGEFFTTLPSRGLE